MLFAQQFAFVSLLYGSLLYQNQTTASLAATAAGSISGVVRDSISGAHLAKRRCVAPRVFRPPRIPEGNYTLRGLKPGRVQISATAIARSGRRIRTVGLLDGQDLTGVDLRVPSIASYLGKDYRRR